MITITIPNWMMTLVTVVLVMQAVNTLLDFYIKYLRERIKKLLKNNQP